MVVAEATEGEVVERAEVSQLDLRSGPDVPRQQTQRYIAESIEELEEIRNPGQHPAGALAHVFRQVAEVGIDQSAAVLWGRVEAAAADQFSHNRPVGATTEVNGLGDVANPELRDESGCQRRLASAARGDERAVDVEQADVPGRHPCSYG